MHSHAVSPNRARALRGTPRAPSAPRGDRDTLLSRAARIAGVRRMFSGFVSLATGLAVAHSASASRATPTAGAFMG